MGDTNPQVDTGDVDATQILTAPPLAEPAAPAQDAVIVSPAPVVMPASPDAVTEASLIESIVPQLRDSLADLLGVAKETLQVGAAYYGPMIARQALLEAAGDEATRTKAVSNRRHLQGQFLMEAGIRGIPLEQRQEVKGLAIFNAALNFAVGLVTKAI